MEEWSIAIALACLGIAIVISGIILLIIRSKLKSVRFERSACNYVRSGSFEVTRKDDKFLYNNITRVSLPKSQGSSGSGRPRR